MEELLKNLAWKCFKNELSMTLYGHGSIGVRYHYDDENGDLQGEDVTEGILKGYERFEKPVDVLKRMNKELDEYLEIEEMEDEEFQTEANINE